MNKLIVLSDLHITQENYRQILIDSCRALKDSLNPTTTGIVILGDIMDTQKEMNRDDQNYLIAYTNTLRGFVEAVLSKRMPPVYLILGNHDNKNEDGIIEIFEETFDELDVTPFGEYKVIDGVYFSHLFNKRGKGFAAKTAKDIFDSVLHSSVSGHGHHFSLYEARALGVNAKTYTTLQCPCVTHYTPWAGVYSQQWAPGYLVITTDNGEITSLARHSFSNEED